MWLSLPRVSYADWDFSLLRGKKRYIVLIFLIFSNVRFSYPNKKRTLPPSSFSPSTNLNLSFTFKTLLLQDVLSRISHCSDYIANMYKSCWLPHYMGCTGMAALACLSRENWDSRWDSSVQRTSAGGSWRHKSGRRISLLIFQFWNRIEEELCALFSWTRKVNWGQNTWDQPKWHLSSPTLSQWKWESPSKSWWWAQVQDSPSWQWGKPNLQWSGKRLWQWWGGLPGQNGWGRGFGWQKM